MGERNTPAYITPLVHYQDNNLLVLPATRVALLAREVQVCGVVLKVQGSLVVLVLPLERSSRLEAEWKWLRP